MTVIGPGRRIFTELLADHFLGHVDRDVLLAVVDAEGQTDELRQDGGAARPDLDHVRFARSFRLLRLLQQIGVDEGAFPDRTCHVLATLLGVARTENVLVRLLVRASLLALGVLAPRGHRGTATRGPAFTTAMRVVDRVHRDAADGRTHALVAHTTGFTEVLVRVVGVRHGTDGGHAFLTHDAQLARREADLGIAAVTADELGVGAGRTGQLTALARLQLDVVHDRTDRHARERHRVARLDVVLQARENGVAHGEALRRQDVGELAVLVLDQRDEGGTVRIVFDPLDDRRNVELATLEIDDAVETLGAATLVPHRDAPGIVPATGLDQALSEGFDRTAFPKLRTVDQNQPTLARRRRLIRLECHAFCLPLACGGLPRLSVCKGPRRSPSSIVKRPGTNPGLLDWRDVAGLGGRVYRQVALCYQLGSNVFELETSTSRTPFSARICRRPVSASTGAVPKSISRYPSPRTAL
ncbi:hypothetical protein SDC9_42012 [bioreactor metagenome]|uniref:Uncharacterized protein n=1 Tax=bioreactor metagenome TaxID=1076179 RepID=A0A644VWM2_9ZZZZ